MINVFRFNTAIIDSNDFAEENLKHTFDFFVSRGFSNFIFLYEFDFELQVPSDSISRVKKLRSRLNSVKPKGVSAALYFKFILTESLKDNYYLPSMIAKGEKNIFIQMPAFCCDESVNSTLNHLLYKNKLLPVFVGFDKNILTCDPVYINDHVFKSSAGVFALEFNFMTSCTESAKDCLFKAIINDVPIITYFSGSLFNYAGFDEVLYNCEANFPKEFLFDLFRQIKRSERLLG